MWQGRLRQNQDKQAETIKTAVKPEEKTVIKEVIDSVGTVSAGIDAVGKTIKAIGGLLADVPDLNELFRKCSLGMILISAECGHSRMMESSRNSQSSGGSTLKILRIKCWRKRRDRGWKYMIIWKV